MSNPYAKIMRFYSKKSAAGTLFSHEMEKSENPGGAW
jgi:hypothetical protein